MAMSNLYLASGGAQLEVNKQRLQEEESLRANEIAQRNAFNDSRRVAIQEEDMGLSRIERQLELRIKKREFEKQEYESNLLRNMQEGTSVANASQGQGQDYERLAQNNRALGMQMNKVDPIRAKKYFEAADSYENAASNRIKTSLEIKSKQVDQAGQILANIGNQEDLNAALPELFANGLPVPPELRDWNNPKTREWITKKALRSPTIAKDLQDQVGFLADKDALAVDKQKNEVIDEQKYNRSLRERASQIKSTSGVGKQSAINTRFNDRIIGAISQSTQDIKNVVSMDLTTTSFAGFLEDKNSVLSATKDTLTKTLTDSDNKMYDAAMSGIERSLAIIEAQGLAPSGALAKSFEALKSQPGDDVRSRLGKLALLRQNVEVAIDGMIDKPSVPDTQKDSLRKLKEDLKVAVPFTFIDIVELEKSKKDDYTLGNLIKAKGVQKKDERASQFKVLR